VTPSTLIRIRGRVEYLTDQSASDENPIGAIGISIVKDAARAAGVGSLPIPITDAGLDMWQYHQYLDSKFRLVSSASDGYVLHQEIDVKAMRKIEDGDAIVVMIEQASAVGALIGFSARFLFLLH